MSIQLLRQFRYAAILGISLLAGYYASTLVFAPSRVSPVQTLTTAEATNGPTGGANGTAPGTAAPAELLTVPDIRLPDLNGGMRALSDWSGQPLLVNFWATWCAPCLREMPMLEALSQSQPKGSLAVIGIAIDRIEDVQPFIDQNSITYPILIGQSAAMEAAQSFGDDFAGLPFTVFAAADGQILGVHAGELHQDQLASIVALSEAVTAGRLSVEEARQRLSE